MSEKLVSGQTRNPFGEILYFIRGTISEGINCQLLGKVLTIVDGAIVDEKQNKAIKDLLKGEFYREVRGIRKVVEDCIHREAKNQGQEIEEKYAEDVLQP